LVKLVLCFISLKYYQTYQCICIMLCVFVQMISHNKHSNQIKSSNSMKRAWFRSEDFIQSIQLEKSKSLIFHVKKWTDWKIWRYFYKRIALIFLLYISGKLYSCIQVYQLISLQDICRHQASLVLGFKFFLVWLASFGCLY